MRELEVGDTVVFRQKKPEEYDETKANDVETEDGTTYTIHRGDVCEYIEASEPAVRVAWDDGAHTTVPVERLNRPDAVEWFDNE